MSYELKVVKKNSKHLSILTKQNGPSLEGPLSVPFIVQYVNRNPQVG